MFQCHRISRATYWVLLAIYFGVYVIVVITSTTCQTDSSSCVEPIRHNSSLTASQCTLKKFLHSCKYPLISVLGIFLMTIVNRSVLFLVALRHFDCDVKKAAQSTLGIFFSCMKVTFIAVVVGILVVTIYLLSWSDITREPDSFKWEEILAPSGLASLAMDTLGIEPQTTFEEELERRRRKDTFVHGIAWGYFRRVIQPLLNQRQFPLAELFPDKNVDRIVVAEEMILLLSDEEGLIRGGIGERENSILCTGRLNTQFFNGNKFLVHLTRKDSGVKEDQELTEYKFDTKRKLKHSPGGSKDKNNTEAKGDKDNTEAKGDKDNTEAKGDKDNTEAKGDKDNTEAKGDKDNTEAKGDKDNTEAKGDNDNTEKKEFMDNTEAKEDKDNTKRKEVVTSRVESKDQDNTEAKEDTDSTGAKEYAVNAKPKGDEDNTKENKVGSLRAEPAVTCKDHPKMKEAKDNTKRKGMKHYLVLYSEDLVSIKLWLNKNRGDKKAASDESESYVQYIEHLQKNDDVQFRARNKVRIMKIPAHHKDQKSISEGIARFIEKQDTEINMSGEEYGERQHLLAEERL